MIYNKPIFYTVWTIARYLIKGVSGRKVTFLLQLNCGRLEWYWFSILYLNRYWLIFLW